MKKILAGVLAAASMLSVSVTAFATDKIVTKAGDVTYDVAVTAPKIVLNLTMPAKMSAVLNPYEATIVVTPEVKADSAKGISAASAVESTKKITSAGYKVSNMSEDYSVTIDATAITTVTTTDKEKWTVSTTAVTDGTKGANMAFMAAAAASDLNPTAVPSASAKWASSKGTLVLDSTVEADKENGVAAGQTTQKGFAVVPAQTPKSADGSTPAKPGVTYLGFTGKLAGDKADGTASVEWKEDDAINIALVLKVNAGKKDAT